jgi:transcription initiation factor TFIID subunit 5
LSILLLDNSGTEETTHNGESATATATATATSLLSTNDTNDDAVTYNVSYKNLREWIENSLDWYKVGGEGRHVQGMVWIH